MAHPAALIFGPQTTLPPPSLTSQLRAALLLNPRLYPLRKCIESLSAVWPVLVSADPALDQVPGVRALKDLTRWLSHGEFPPAKAISELPSAFVTPFTVILHIVQYLSYTDSKHGPGPRHEHVLESVRDQGGVQGFCSGLLAAITVATSPDVETVFRRAEVALRLAVGIGAYIDLDCVGSKISSIAVKSRPATPRNELQGYFDELESTYVSVVTDASSSTVTTPTALIEAVAQKLKAQGFAMKQVDLRGRFHYPGHARAVETLRRLADSNPDFQLPHTDALLAPVYSNVNGKPFPEGPIGDTLIESILLQRCDWYSTMSAAFAGLTSEDATVVQFGPVECVPASLLRRARASVHRVTSIPGQEPSSSAIPATIERAGKAASEPIAIIGMACKVPGADSLEEFWDLMMKGISMCTTMPEERFKTTGLRRSEDGKLKFFGNFVKDVDAFDHRFFKKSSREAASMDPQQRLLMEVAYQAIESAEYTGPAGNRAKRDIGCYIGACSNDYNDNVASHQPNAFSSLGTLRAFLSGKISHFFGWTGPSITYDTACSSSAVAIQAACMALQMGECSMALAGGVSFYTNPFFYQNLAAASFLSPTGPTKPFDARGDGYCRGEGAGLVFLKPLSVAVADDDNILGVIAAAAVNQNENSTSITVPHTGSQIELYQKVVSDSGLHAHDITYIEAHGTGTPVGDPREITSIREVFGGSDRSETLAISSVKGNIGHLEGASGVASLIKTILMMHHGTIPMQANHTQLNPKIEALEQDKMLIPLTNQPWNAKFKAACINNYGAAGSNAAMIVYEPPNMRSKSQQLLPKYPIVVAANSSLSLKSYCSALLQSDMSLPDLAFHLANRQNRSFPYVLITSVSSQNVLREHLSAVVEDRSSSLQQAAPTAKPVVLVFGGQTSTSIGLSRAVYDSSALLRSHLEKCDRILRSTGLKSIFPALFQTEPITDVVLLHSALFSVQYACAMSWIDAGLAPSALVGHSFGQLTALAVSGVLSLKDGIALVTGRAWLMQTAWGPETGEMISILADLHTVTRLITQPDVSGNGNGDLEIACFNGRTSHVVVGNAEAVDRLQGLLDGEGIRYKRLNVSHGFHSKFTEPILPGLEECVRGLTFREPRVPIETCSKDASWSEFDAAKIVQHTRTPVYFAQAIDRVTARLGACTWLEAGFGSSVTGMIRHSLEAPASHLFQPVQLGGDNAVAALADTTVALWRAGHRVQFWPFDRCERASYSTMGLGIPPYQFEKNRHWLDWKDTVNEAPAPTAKETPSEFLTFVNGDDKAAEFRVSTQHETYLFFVKGHAAIEQPLCPAPLYLDLASQASRIVSSTSDKDDSRPSIEDLDIQAPLGVSDRVIILRLQQSSTPQSSWKFSFTSKPTNGSADEQLHATGIVIVPASDSRTADEFARYGRLVSIKRCRELSSDPECQALQGPVVYQLFSKVVTYADYYKGVQSVYASGGQVTGRVRLPQIAKDPELRRPLLIDSFIQTSGIHVNCLSDVGPKEVFVCNKVDRVQLGPAFTTESVVADASWIVYSSSHAISDREVSNDIFVFNATTEELVVFILGARFTRVLISSLLRVLSRANAADGAPAKFSTEKPVKAQVKVQAAKPVAPPPVSKIAVPDVISKLKTILSEIVEVPVADIRDSHVLADLGVDSLLGTEVLNEINDAFNVSITPGEFDVMADVASIAKSLQAFTGVQDSGYDSEGVAESVCSSSDVCSGTCVTPAITTPDDSVARLADLVAGHLECDEVTEASNLADLGLDSILSIELATDIKKIFGFEIDVSQLDTKSTFSDLVTLALPGYGEAALPAVPPPAPVMASKQGKNSDIAMETVLFKQAEQTPLYADIYYPPAVSDTPRPIALMVHGGGHIMLSRKDIRPRQTAHLHSLGFLPISIDYRLCPESPLIDGPMRDVCDAITWARKTLHTIPLGCQGLKIDPSRVVLVGWSTGGHLAMTTAYTTIERGLETPDAILAFYCATDFEDPFWSHPNYPENSEALSRQPYNLLEGVQKHPITAYNVPSSARAVGGWMAPQDPRSRIVLHMNWKGQFMPVLLRGLPHADSVSESEAQALLCQPQPPLEEIQRASPYAQIKNGNYHTPTFIIHGTEDDLIPWTQSVRTIEALKAQGVRADIATPRGKFHLFDMYRDPDGSSWEVVRKGYEFLVDVIFGKE